jgi:hypothetical protein
MLQSRSLFRPNVYSAFSLLANWYFVRRFQILIKVRVYLQKVGVLFLFHVCFVTVCQNGSPNPKTVYIAMISRHWFSCFSCTVRTTSYSNTKCAKSFILSVGVPIFLNHPEHFEQLIQILYCACTALCSFCNVFAVVIVFQ